MREIIEDAIVIYRQEVENLIFVAAPAIVLGPILVLVAASGFLTNIVTVALLALLYAVVYSACVSAAGLIHNNQEPDPLSAYAWTLRRLFDTARTVGPAVLGLVLTLETASAIGHLGFADLAFALGLIVTAFGVYWASKHALEQPMTVAFGATLDEAREYSEELAVHQGMRGIAFYTVVSLPVLLGELICLGLASSIKPELGAAFLAAIVALWLPFCALAITAAGARWLNEAVARPSQVSVWEQR